MTRKQELLELVKDNPTLIPLVDEIVYLEDQLIYLKKLPFIQVHPKDPSRQRATPASKLYKELLQQYTNSIKVIIRATGIDETEEESPLRRWVKEHVDQENDNLDT